MSQVTQITKELLDRMGFEDAHIEERVQEGRIKIDIKISDARSLIGERGATLAMFQHVVRRVVTKKNSETKAPSPPSSDDFLSDVNLPPRAGEQQVDIDVNGYKTMRENVLKDFAQDIAQKVRAQKKSVELEPMPSFDRRIIHLALSSFPDLATESMGEGNGRYIVVRPYP